MHTLIEQQADNPAYRLSFHYQFIAKAIPDINLCLGTALENHNYDIILSAAESFVTASKLREYCPYDIDNRTYQRDIRLIDGSLKRYAEYMTSILLMP